MPMSKTAFAGAAVVILATAANMWYNNRDRARDPLTASALPIGTNISAVTFAALPGDKTQETTAAGAGGCHLVVIYSPTCTHCHAAAARAAALPVAQRLPTTWVSVTPDTLAHEFAAKLGEGSTVRSVKEAKRTFQVSAVPAAILIGADNRVKAVFGYSGKEDRAFLQSQCN